MGIILALVLLPPIVIFVYNIYKDPVTPELVQRVQEIAKEKTLGYLSKRKAKDDQNNDDISAKEKLS